jgi:hypothetical protein
LSYLVKYKSALRALRLSEIIGIKPVAKVYAADGNRTIYVRSGHDHYSLSTLVLAAYQFKIFSLRTLRLAPLR